MRWPRMPRFYLHLCDGDGLVEDEEGVELPDEAAARTAALASARDIMMDEVRSGTLDLTSSIKVEDEDGMLLFTLPFAEALVIKH